MINNQQVLKWALIISIIIVSNLFFHFATRLVYKQPQFENFCQAKQVNIEPGTKDDCLAVGGSWNEGPQNKPVPANIDNQGRIIPGPANSYCDIYFTCQKDFNSANELYRRNIFLILVLLGLISLIIGLTLSISEVISLGLSYSGILAFIVASIQYWSAMDDYLRVIILGLALAVLIYLGYNKFKQ